MPFPRLSKLPPLAQAVLLATGLAGAQLVILGLTSEPPAGSLGRVPFLLLPTAVSVGTLGFWMALRHGGPFKHRPASAVKLWALTGTAFLTGDLKDFTWHTAAVRTIVCIAGGLFAAVLLLAFFGSVGKATHQQ